MSEINWSDALDAIEPACICDWTGADGLPLLPCRVHPVADDVLDVDPVWGLPARERVAILNARARA